MKITNIQLSALVEIKEHPVLEGTVRISKYLISELASKQLIASSRKANGTFWTITDKGRLALVQVEAENQNNKTAKAFKNLKEASERGAASFKRLSKVLLALIFALTATISYGQKLPDLSSAIIGQTITLDDC